MRESTEQSSPAEFTTIKVAFLTWNINNSQISDADMNVWQQEMARHGDVDAIVDAIVVGTQEESRSSGHQLANRLLASSLKDTFKKVDEQHFNTFTKARGRVAQTVLIRQKGVEYKHHDHKQFNHSNGLPKFANKGGIINRVEVNGVRLNTLVAHLDAYSVPTRIYEMKTLMNLVERQGQDYISFADMMRCSSDHDQGLIESNERNEIFSSGDRLHPFDFAEYDRRKIVSPAQHIQRHALRDAQRQYKSKEEKERFSYPNEETTPSEFPIDPKNRQIGIDNRVYGEHGVLEKFLSRGSKQTSFKLIEGTRSSDHKPALSIVTIRARKQQSDFERTRAWIQRVLEPWLSKELEQHIQSTEDSDENRRFLELVYNYFLNVKALYLKADSLQFRAQPAAAEAMKLLANKIKDIGNTSFRDKSIIRDKQCFNALMRQCQQEVGQSFKTGPLQSHRAWGGWILNLFVKLITCWQSSYRTGAKSLVDATINRLSFFAPRPQSSQPLSQVVGDAPGAHGSPAAA